MSDLLLYPAPECPGLSLMISDNALMPPQKAILFLKVSCLATQSGWSTVAAKETSAGADHPQSNVKVDHPVTGILRWQETQFFPSFPPLAPISGDISECHAIHLHSLQDRRMLAIIVKPLNIDSLSPSPQITLITFQCHHKQNFRFKENNNDPSSVPHSGRNPKKMSYPCWLKMYILL